MLLTLPLILFIVMAELSVGAFSVLFVLDWRNEVKRSFLITYALIYLVLTGLTYLFQQGFSSPELLNTYAQLDKGWTGYLSLPLLLFVLAMIYRPLAAANLGGVFTVASFFAAALALGGVMTAMWLGHWYLVTPALSERPLLFATTLVLLGVLIQIVLAFSAGPGIIPARASQSVTQGVTATATPTVPAATPAIHATTKPANVPVVTPLSTGALGWLRILLGFILPLVLGGLAWKLVRDRSFQSATGMLYLVVVCALAGEAMARGLFLMGL